MSEIKGFNDPFDGRAFFYNPKELENIERLKHCGGRLIDDFSEFVRVSCFTGNGGSEGDRKAGYRGPVFCTIYTGWCVC